ncbi:DUF6076 domain-containing protein [Anoxynatronum sibiricum]|uniref:DUF6076 domain-containing protein n=1 Tax=Anoxynatronum sibiricum TaxID=210623 RepID=A0ABU9VX73_9CLOT
MISVEICFNKKEGVESLTFLDERREEIGRTEGDIGEALVGFIEADINAEEIRRPHLLNCFLEESNEFLIDSNKVKKDVIGRIQDHYKRKIKQVLDRQNIKLAQLDSHKRLLYYEIFKKNYYSSDELLRYEMQSEYEYCISAIVRDGEGKFTPYTLNIINIRSDDEEQNDFINAINDLEFSITEKHKAYNIENVCEILFLELVKRNVVINTCANCGKLFKPERASDKYCLRQVNGEKRCTDIGYRNKVKKHPILSLFERKRKTRNREKQVACKRENFTEETKKKYREAYEKWYEEYSELKNKYVEAYDRAEGESEKRNLETEFEGMFKKLSDYFDN